MRLWPVFLLGPLPPPGAPRCLTSASPSRVPCADYEGYVGYLREQAGCAVTTTASWRASLISVAAS